MSCSRFALRLLTRTGAAGFREELVGDVLEELAHGRSGWWLCQQLIGLYGLALVAGARRHLRPTPFVIVLALSTVLLAGISIGAFGSVLEAWLGFYLVAGTLSLFAHLLSRAQVDARL